jgi:hypothetical protein
MTMMTMIAATMMTNNVEVCTMYSYHETGVICGKIRLPRLEGVVVLGVCSCVTQTWLVSAQDFALLSRHNGLSADWPFPISFHPILDTQASG